VGTTSVLSLAAALWLVAPAAATAAHAVLPPAGATSPAVSQEQSQDPPPAEKDKKKKKAPEDTADTDGDSAQDDVRVTWKTGPSLRLGRHGRVDFKLLVQGDLRSSGQDLEEAGGLFDSPRHRAGVKGTLFDVLEFEVQKELGDGPWRDVYVNVRPIAAVQVQYGKFKIPFSMDQLAARHDLDFLYRTLAAETLAPNRDVGVMLHGSLWKRFVRYEAGFFRGDGENAPSLEYPPLRPGEVPDAPSKRSIAGRLRVRPLSALPKSKLFDTLEFGVSAMRSEVPEGTNHLQGETLFETKIFKRQYYVNGPRDRWSYEASWTPGPLSLRAEYIKVNEARQGVGTGDESGLDGDLASLPSSGWYLSGTWALTGEKKESGIDQPRRPFLQGGYGGIELAARYEKIQFGGGDASQPPSISPRADFTIRNADEIITLGVNWYVNRFVKLQLNGIRETVDDPATSPIPGQTSVWTVAFRFQFWM